jgi:uncharacterized membrane protein YesL
MQKTKNQAGMASAKRRTCAIEYCNVSHSICKYFLSIMYGFPFDISFKSRTMKNLKMVYSRSVDSTHTVLKLIIIKCRKVFTL